MTMYRQSWDTAGSPDAKPFLRAALDLAASMTVGYMEQPRSELCGQTHIDMGANSMCEHQGWLCFLDLSLLTQPSRL